MFDPPPPRTVTRCALCVPLDHKGPHTARLCHAKLVTTCDYADTEPLTTLFGALTAPLVLSLRAQ